jgi:hypothetical protein
MLRVRAVFRPTGAPAVRRKAARPLGGHKEGEVPKPPLIDIR